jgi:uncharacterized protein YjiS (DUF1127 family)
MIRITNLFRRGRKERQLDSFDDQRLRDMGIDPDSLRRNARYPSLLFYPVWPPRGE